MCLGSGGHAAVVIDAARLAGFDVAGVIDNEHSDAAVPFGLPRLGSDGSLNALAGEFDGFINGVGGAATNDRRAAAFEFAATRLAARTVKHPLGVVSEVATVGTGCFIGPTGVVQAGATLGRNVIVNTGAIIEHGASIGDHAHIAPRTVVLGDASVGAGAFVGAGAIVFPRVIVGRGAVVGAGSVVRDDVEAGNVVAGVPAKPLSA